MYSQYNICILRNQEKKKKIKIIHNIKCYKHYCKTDLDIMVFRSSFETFESKAAGIYGNIEVE